MKTNKPKVLVVENENIIALDIKKTLEKIGCEIINIANSGEKAIEIILQQKPDLITMNLNLNGNIDGEATADLIYNRYKIPIVFVSGSITKEQKLNSMFKDTVFYLRKPFRRTDLVEMVKQALRKFNPENL